VSLSNDNWCQMSAEADRLVSSIKKDLDNLSNIYEALYKESRKVGSPSLSEYRRLLQVSNGCHRVLSDVVKRGRKAYLSHEDFRTKVLDSEADHEKSGNRSNYSRVSFKKLPVKRNVSRIEEWTQIPSTPEDEI